MTDCLAPQPSGASVGHVTDDAVLIRCGNCIKKTVKSNLLMHAFATAQHQPHLVCIAVMTLCAIATHWYGGPNQLLFTITDISNWNCWYQQFKLLISLINCWYQQLITDTSNWNCWYQQFKLLISLINCWYQQLISDISNLNYWYQQFQLLISLIIIADINSCVTIVFYSPSIVTMAVSLTVYGIFSDKV